MKYCINCGEQIEDSVLFCNFCGHQQPLNIDVAVVLAKAGDNRGFEYLYNETYKDKKYLALKYVKNEQDAEDVLQDSYIKMMSSINSLDDPKKFSSWFGMIVANKAKDLLRKQNRKDAEGNSRRDVLFSEMEAEDSDGDVMEYEFEDENTEWQPEVAYTQKETQDLVRVMMSTLSDEQRMALIMFHIEGMSIKEIAEAMDVSENTVKSRLNYARKNIKTQGEELRKKGYKLYSFAPLPLLLYLIRLEAHLSGATGISGMAGGTAGGTVSTKITAESSAVSYAGKAGSQSAIISKSGATLGTKILIGALAGSAAITGTIVALNISRNRNITSESSQKVVEMTTDEPETTEATISDTTEATTEAITEITTEATTEVTTEAKIEYPDDLVVDSDISQYGLTFNGSTYDRLIPKINFDSEASEKINEEISAEFSNSGYPAASYEWWRNDDVLTIVFHKYEPGVDTAYVIKVYSVDLKQDRVCDNSYFLEMAGMSSEDYKEKLRTGLNNYLHQSGFYSLVREEETYTDSNLQSFELYLGEDGELWVCGNAKVDAGAGNMWTDFSLNEYAD